MIKLKYFNSVHSNSEKRKVNKTRNENALAENDSILSLSILISLLFEDFSTFILLNLNKKILVDN